MPDAPTKPLSAMDSVGPAVNRTEKILFHPFRWSYWWRVALLGLATGEAASQGGVGFNNFNGLKDIQGGGSGADLGTILGGMGGSGGGTPPHMPELAAFASVFAVLVVGVVVLVFVHLYVMSVSRFMLLEAVARGSIRIRESWSRWHSHGLRYYFFQLVFGAIALTVTVGIFAGPLLAAYHSGVFHDFQHRWTTLLAAVLVVLPFYFVFALITLIAGVLIKDFAVPIIALEDITIPGALAKLWNMVKTAKGDFTVYILLKALLTLAIGIGLTIAYVILALILIVPTVIIAVAIGVASPHLLQDPLMIALVITLGLIAVVPIMFVAGLIATPAVVFYQSYVLNFFGSRYAPLWVFMHPEGMPTPPQTTHVGGGHEPPPYDIVPPEPAG